MAKHRRQNRSIRRIAIASAAAAGTVALTPGVAGALGAQLPYSGQTVDIPGAENIPGAAQFINDVTGQAAQAAPEASQAAPKSQAQQIVDIAHSKIGAPYAYGAAGPDAFDCSGFTSWVYAQVGKQIPRTSQAQAAGGQQISRENLQPGDIISFYGGASHVGIYIGDGKIIDALNSGTPVGVRTLDYMPYHSAVRF